MKKFAYSDTQCEDCRHRNVCSNSYRTWTYRNTKMYRGCEKWEPIQD